MELQQRNLSTDFDYIFIIKMNAKEKQNINSHTVEKLSILIF